MRGVRALLCACLFLVACKTEESKQAAEAKPAEATKVERPRATPRPSLPDQDDMSDDEERYRPRLEEQPRDWSDPAVREEMRQRREERRKAREAELDTNKDGVISAEEKLQRLQPMIDRFDKNGDGRLTPDELASSNRRKMFDDPAALDTDKDGFISLPELDTAVKARREKMRARWRGRGGGSAVDVGSGE
jgi:Ca2+-binding EF-hand superfamily protein